jgi:hypothetical protein
MSQAGLHHDIALLARGLLLLKQLVEKVQVAGLLLAGGRADPIERPGTLA